MNDKTININVPVLARVEGEGALDLTIEQGKITDLKLRIFEPPRYFEKFLEGRSYRDIPDTVARICGICPVAYQMSAVHAIESIFHTQTTPWTRALRRVFYCGEWIQSHSLHIHLLAAPDFLGYQSVIEMARNNGEAAQRGLRLQALGNDLMALIGGRSVHPVSVCAGGFYHAPAQDKVAEMVKRLEQGYADSAATLRWVASLELPEAQQAFTSVALRHPEEYAMNEGRIVSDQGLDIPIDEFQQHFAEQHIPHSTALHCLLDGKPYLLGPLARVNLNHSQLPPEVIAPLAGCGIPFPSRNMHHSIVARAIETRFAIHEALRLLRDYQLPEQPAVAVAPQAGVGYGCTEAPRGLLWHHYELDDEGKVVHATIVPPTSQNQARIEQDIRLSLEAFGLDQDENALRFHAERVIRNYDPCISCATHFLQLNITRDGDPQPAQPEQVTIAADSLIIAVGSPFGADNIAWRVAEQLHPQRGIEITTSDRPAAELLSLIHQAESVIILDALLGGGEPGSLVMLDQQQLAAKATLSSHGIGIKELLALAGQLNPPRPAIQLLGICIDPQAPTPNDKLILKAVQAVQALITP